MAMTVGSLKSFLPSGQNRGFREFLKKREEPEAAPFEEEERQEDLPKAWRSDEDIRRLYQTLRADALARGLIRA